MKNTNFWRVAMVLLLAWAINELYPPTSKDLIVAFQEHATAKDTNFTQIVNGALSLREADKKAGVPDRSFANLLDAIGTTDIVKYFPNINVATETKPTRAILNRVQRDSAGKIKLGLDLQGGTSFLVEMDTKAATDAERPRMLEQAVEVLRKRVDRFGVAEPLIIPAGDNRILIQLPGLSEADKESAKTQLQKAAYLEFRLVHPDSRNLLNQGIMVPGYRVMKMKQKDAQGRDAVSSFLVKTKAERGLSGKHIKTAGVSHNPNTGKPEIIFSLNDEGAKLFAEVTRENIGHQLAIILDDELYSAPNIEGEIPAGHGQITGNFDLKEAFELANTLQNPLEAPVKIVEERGVDPSLGRDSIRSGIKASIIGTLAVSIFMICYYFLAGFVANIALIMNMVISMGVMCSFGTTLTIPGIAGLVLTVGMAVDANVLIYERIREELAAGKSLKGAVNAGYAKAFGTIFDSHCTTLISSIILIFMGTGSVKGFGVTLTIGVTLSLFTALVVTRLIFDTLLSRNMIKSLPMLHIIRGTKIDFMKVWKIAFTISWTLIIIGNGYGLYRGSKVMGPDFKGGDSLVLKFSQRIEAERLRATVEQLKIGEPLIQYQKDLSSGLETLRITAEFGAGPKIESALNSSFPAAKFQRLALDKVGPTVGREIQKSAIIASMLAMFGILVYVAFRYEFSFAVGAVVAIVHDILMTMGWFFLTGRQLSAPMVAAVLTIIGFSINDTIVIFDRIREDLKLGVRGTFKEVMNKALNQTLSRSIITSGTVFLATFSLYIFGGGVINDFAFTFLVGIITGTYSSIYIASAIVLWWHKGERPKIGASQVTMDHGVSTARV